MSHQPINPDARLALDNSVSSRLGFNGVRRTSDSAAPTSTTLSNGAYSVHIDRDGRGRSLWNGIDITRWRDDAHDANGFRLFILDRSSCDVWSPMGNRPASSIHDDTMLSDSAARFYSQRFGVEARVEISVPGDIDAEVCSVALRNTSGQTRTLEITSYVELALAPHAADLGHPCFSKLFVKTAAPGRALLTAQRRRRSAQDTELWAAHLMAIGSKSHDIPLDFETSRLRFVGRNRSSDAPIGLFSPLSGSVGSVLDPFSASAPRSS